MWPTPRAFQPMTVSRNLFNERSVTKRAETR